MRFLRTAVILTASCAALLCLGSAVWADGEPVQVENTKEFVPPPPPPEAPPEEALAPPDYLFPLPPPPQGSEVEPTVRPSVEPGPGTEPTAEPVVPKKQLHSLQAVPADAVAALWLTDLGRTRTLLTDCSLGKLAAEPGMRKLLKRISARLESPAPGGPSFAFLARAVDLVGHLSDDAAIGLLKRKDGVAAILVAAVGDEKRLTVAAAARDLAVALAGARGTRTVAVREKFVAGVPLSEVLGEGVTVYHGFVENLCVLATDLGTAEAAVKLATGGGAGSFEGSAARTECVRVLAGKAEVDLYFSMDLDRLLASAKPDAVGGVKPLLSAILGKKAAKLGALHYALVVDGARVHERMAVRGALAEISALAREPIAQNAAILRYVSPDALYFEVTNADLDSMIDLMNSLPGKGFKLLLGGAEIEKKDLLAAFDGRLGSGAFVSRAGGLDLLIVAGVKDPKPLHAILRPLHAKMGVTGTENFMGETLHFVPKGEKLGGAGRASARKLSGGGLGALPMTPGASAVGLGAYCITKDRVLVVTSSAEVLRKSLRNASRRRRNVLALPHVKEALRGLPLAEASSLGYLDTERAVELLYAAADSPLLGMFLGGKGADALPLLDEILPHLSGTAWTNRRLGDLVRADIYSPTGFVPLAAVGAIAVLPFFSSATASSGHSVHEKRLRLIWRGLQNYATDHGRFPRNLEDLQPDYVQLSIPGARLGEKEERAILAQYRLVAGRRPNDHDRAPLAYTSDPVGAQHVVLLVGGDTVPVPEKDLGPFVRGEIDLEDLLERAQR